ncbi:MAG: preprotein translocase subunit SecG [Sterolibacterium sp.]|jgi:preprotein translocase subunit SecG|nr:preprotein translocase subunit SecG [Sterolibacterium sp.]MBP9800009.1 preprotein translocase subunit SecG [Sterolibacterium sp.]
MHDFLYPLALTVHLLVGLTIIGLVLLQHGKGADMGAAFGGGASGSLFGATGSANFLSRTTAVLAAVFFMTSLGLSYMATNRAKPAASVLDVAKGAAAPVSAPATTGAPAAAGAATPAAPASAPAPDSKAGDIPK